MVKTVKIVIVNKHMFDNGFNVLDKYKHMSVDDIKTDYQKNTINAAIAVSHIESDYNLSSIVRAANFCGFKEVFYIGGKKQWDRRGSVGTHHYIPITFCKTIDEFSSLIQDKYTPVALENNILDKKVENIFTFTWPYAPVIICGEEQNGIPNDILNICQYFVEIPAKGTVRSMNVGTAAGIAMSLYLRSIL